MAAAYLGLSSLVSIVDYAPITETSLSVRIFLGLLREINFIFLGSLFLYVVSSSRFDKSSNSVKGLIPWFHKAWKYDTGSPRLVDHRIQNTAMTVARVGPRQA
jgi:hypothetical protein